ncbi:ciliary microtubule inner protein 1-like [Ciona intestinalis]
MAANAKVGRQVAGCNFVANDEIWKSHVHMEWAASKKWPQNWGFMTQTYKELSAEAGPSKKEDKPKVELPEQLRLAPITPIEKYIKIGESPPYPDTTTGLVGWRSTKPDCKLEIYGAYAKGKGGLVKQLNWPQEGII